MDALTALAGMAVALLASFLLLYVSDRLWDTPVGLRILLSFAGFGVAVWFAWGWMQLWVLARRDIHSLAGLVQGRFRRLGDRLLGIVELADEQRRPPNVSPELCQAAIRQVSKEAAQFDFRAAVATRKPRMFVAAALALLVLILAPLAMVPEVTWNTLARWLWPSSNVERFTFVRLEDVPTRLVVAHGEPFEIACLARFHPFWQPTRASVQLAGQQAVKVSAREGRVVFPIPGQTQPVEVTLRMGDVRREIAIEPLLRPALKGLLANVTFPDYLQHTNRQFEVSKGAFSFLDGSRIAFHGRTSRELGGATLELAVGSSVEQTPALRVDQEWFLSDPLDLAGLTQASFAWKDEWGLAAASPWKLSLTAEPDGAPDVECPQLAAAIAILEEEVVDIRAVAGDDYGLKHLELAWESRKRQQTNLLASGTVPLQEGAPHMDSLEGTYAFSPALMDIPPDTVVDLQARTRDYFPGRPPSVSSAFKIYVLSYEEHARLIQQELERLMAELEDITRRQEALREAGQSLQATDPESLASPESKRQLDAQANEQAALSQKLSQVARNASNTLKEALRNKTIPTDLIEEWARMAEAMQNLASQPMASAAQQLASAGQNQDQRAESLQQALEIEEEILRRLMELQQQIGPALDRLLANTLAQRLRAIAGTEARIAKTVQSMLPNTIGLAPDQLEPVERNTLSGMVADQDRTRREATDLHDEIRRFFERTREPKHGEVSTQMNDQKMSEGLLNLSGLLGNNVGTLAMQSAHSWETKFEDWAKLLEEAEPSEGGGGGGGGSMSEEALKRLLALLRIRQQEINIRTVTGILEERRETSRGYREDSIILSIRQNYLVEDVAAVAQAGAGKFLGEARQAMGEAESLLMQPRTDAPAVAAETDAINLLEAEIMDMMQSSQGSPMAGAMAMMMQMMGMAPGGNFAGGYTDEPNEGLVGDVSGGGTDERNVDKTSGRSSRIVPAEFRDVLQEYYKAVDQLEASRPKSP